MAEPVAQPEQQFDETLHPTLAALFAEIEASAPPDRRDALVIFAKMFLRRLDEEELEPPGASRTCSGWCCRRTDSLTPEAITPPSSGCSCRPLIRRATHLPGTVIETNTDDSPFLVDSVAEELNARGLAVHLVLHPMLGTASERGRTARAGAVEP